MVDDRARRTGPGLTGSAGGWSCSSRTLPAPVSPWLECALLASRWTEDRADALLPFDSLTEPLATFWPSYGLEVPFRFDVEVGGDEHWLREAWRETVAPNLADAAPAVLTIADRHLPRAHLLLRRRPPLWLPTEPAPRTAGRSPVPRWLSSAAHRCSVYSRYGED